MHYLKYIINDLLRIKILIIILFFVVLINLASFSLTKNAYDQISDYQNLEFETIAIDVYSDSSEKYVSNAIFALEYNQEENSLSNLIVADLYQSPVFVSKNDCVNCIWVNPYLIKNLNLEIDDKLFIRLGQSIQELKIIGVLNSLNQIEAPDFFSDHSNVFISPNLSIQSLEASPITLSKEESSTPIASEIIIIDDLIDFYRVRILWTELIIFVFSIIFIIVFYLQYSDRGRQEIIRLNNMGRSRHYKNYLLLNYLFFMIPLTLILILMNTLIQLSFILNLGLLILVFIMFGFDYYQLRNKI